MDDFVSQANALVAKYNLSVTFGMDGDGTVRYPCLSQRWRPWVSTYVQGRDPAAAFYSNNKSLGWDRYQILDDETLAVPVGESLRVGTRLARHRRVAVMVLCVLCLRRQGQVG